MATAHQPLLFRGFHSCEFRKGGGRPWGFRNLLVPTARRLYVAPESIVHYVEGHGYRPPGEFLDALPARPDQQSAGYLDLLQRFARSTTLSRPAWPLDPLTPQRPTS